MKNLQGMFFPLAFLSKKTSISRLYIYSCYRSSACIPVNMLSKCVDSVCGERLSLRLWSRLSLALLQAMLAHYKGLHTDALKLIKAHAQDTPGRKEKILPAHLITLPVVSDLFITLNQAPPSLHIDESIEYPRAYSSSLLLPSSLPPSVPGPFEHPRSIPKRDRRTDISLREIKRVFPPQPNPIRTVLLDILKAHQDVHIESEIDISSIEMPRYTFDQSISEAYTQRLSSADASLPSNILEGTHSSIAEFFSILIRVTEGSISASQNIPYGEISIFPVE